MDQKFWDMLKSIPVAISQSINIASSSLTTLTNEQQAVKEQLITFLKEEFPNLFSKKNEGLVEDFKTSIYDVDKTINNRQEIFKIKL